MPRVLSGVDHKLAGICYQRTNICWLDRCLHRSTVVPAAKTLGSGFNRGVDHNLGYFVHERQICVGLVAVCAVVQLSLLLRAPGSVTLQVPGLRLYRTNG